VELEGCQMTWCSSVSVALRGQLCALDGVFGVDGGCRRGLARWAEYISC